MNISIGKLLATHGGRDKFVRTLCYASRFCATIVPSKQLADSLNSIGKEMSGCRTTLRLFDDIPMLNHVLSYGLGKEDEDLVVRILTVVGNAVDVVYYPFEHAAWAADHRLLSLDSRPLWTATSFCWAISMYLDLLKNSVTDGRCTRGARCPQVKPSMLFLSRKSRRARHLLVVSARSSTSVICVLATHGDHSSPQVPCLESRL
ncbi:peroxisomal membrane protein 11C-like isoform X1 [Bacillus rossius redtenbacheri]|uniref:peroxisomal membrane protein 11C-like isoform X1 n=1 Tax=Bacillus rossius redtenbacheri TaxID=93214 RepID=UPI002FDE1232